MPYFLLLCLFVIHPMVFAADLDCEKQHCLAVVDAGSTGSRLHLYTYDYDAAHNPTHIVERHTKKIKPGFAVVAAETDDIQHYLETLFSGFPVTSVPVYFYATGGMRLLSAPEQEKRYNVLRNWFARHTEFSLLDARTIAGAQEGLYGWLAVNYQTGVFSDPAQDMVGMMDMGGASVQIAFPVESSSALASQDILTLHRFGRTIHLYVHSFLGLGQTDVEHQFLDTPSCFALQYPLSGLSYSQGDAVACTQHVADLVNTVHQVYETVASVVRSSDVKNWYVLGGLAYMAESKAFDFQGGSFDSQRMLDKADRDICSHDWPDLVSHFPDDPYLYGYCLFPAYYYALIVDGYGLAPATSLHLMQNADADWTMGVVLMQ